METLPPKGRSGGDKSRRPLAQKRSRIKDHGGVRMTEISSFYEEEEDELCPTLKEACRQGLFHPTLTWKEAIGDDPDWDSYLPKDEPPNEGSFPKLNITAEEYKKLWEPWRKTLIVKILGKSPAFNLLFSKLRSLWNLKAKFSLVDIGNDFYLVKVENPEDYLRILTEGPWVVGGYYLTVRKWKPFFNSSEETVLCTSVWVRLPRLPVEFFNSEILRDVGNLVGKTVKIDRTTEESSGTGGNFARICVEVDLKKPLMGGIIIGSHWQKLEYEGLDSICFDCGVYGHSKGSDACTMAIKTEQDAAAMELPHQINQKQAKQVEKEKGPLGTRMVAQRRDKTKKQQSATMAAVETSVNNGELTDYASNASDSSDDWTDDSSDDWTDGSSEDGSEMGKQISMLTEKKQGATAMELPHQNNQKHTKKVEEKDPFGPWMVAQRREKTKKQLPTMAVGWPPEDVNVIIDILSRLPVKSILRFRCVNKTWSSLFKSESFIIKHLETSANNGLIFIKYCNRDCYSKYSNTVRLLTDDTYEDHSDFPIPFKSCSGWLKVLGSVHGLVCLYDYHHQVSGSKIFLYNPSIRQHKVLPVFTVTRPKSKDVRVDLVALGFGYDKTNDDYKIIRVASLRYNVKGREFYKNQADLYSLKMDSWKEVRLKDCVNFDLLEEYQASIGGAIHWLASTRGGRFTMYNLIVSYDVSAEEFRCFPLPPCVAGGVGEHGQKLIFERGNSLCVINCRWGRNIVHYDIWLMKEYGVQKLWTRLTSVSFPGASNLLGFGVNGELFLETGRRLAMFDLETKEHKDLGINGECYSLTPYVESLVSLSGGTYDDDVGHGSYFDSRASSCDYDFDGSDPFFFK